MSPVLTSASQCYSILPSFKQCHPCHLTAASPQGYWIPGNFELLGRCDRTTQHAWSSEAPYSCTGKCLGAAWGCEASLTCRSIVDLPPMFGPVMTIKLGLLRSTSFGTKSVASAAPTACRNSVALNTCCGKSASVCIPLITPVRVTWKHIWVGHGNLMR